ncbi:MAG TPA: phosphoribosylanthranilate isomerase [Chromatiaceae bacterium]|nr:phosphoribosylanthranilate isomerase [Chromatiaceae bacterium]
MRTRVKICGITRPEDADAAARAGADAIGLVFYPPSPRHVEVARAARIARGLPPFVSVVALFVNADREYIDEVLSSLPVDIIQFHGNECPDYCASFGKPWLKAIAMKEGVDLRAEAERHATASALLVDTYRPGVPGGTGEVFDWRRIPPELAGRIVLAGGLKAENVADAVRQARPWAVDVSGGVEQRKGIKDARKIADFIQQVKRADERHD